MSLLDKSLFKKTLKVIGVRVEAKKIGPVVKRLHGHLLNLPRLRNVVPDPMNPEPYKNSSSKLILLNTKVKDAETLQPLSEDLISFLRTESLSFVTHAIELDYSYFAVDQVLSELLPEENLLPHKHIIGQVILDKNASIRTVVNKTDNIETKFRTFPMEVLAGDNDMDVEVHESKAIFRFNYAQVYWNSRLQQEHLRVIRMIKSHDVVCDMMCGIGPFAIPIALKGTKVLANDLNPRSYHYLKENIALNKVKHLVTPYNLDGREFVTKLLSEKKQFTHVLMNLPAIALDFLDVFPGKFDHWEGELPYIHCYCFSNADDVKMDVQKRAEKILGGKLDFERTSCHLVRDVAPKKVMVCISFQLPKSIAFSSEYHAMKQDDFKRQKVEMTA
ncbi:putative tRNA (guanine(37)-N(1))-methyltransferase, SAM-dependent methyltransferase TRM5/TYW2-type [Plasmopara halstedii]